MPELRPERPALLLSSTSWTADEDFSLLLTALDKYQEAINTGTKLPKLLVIITGKGALRKPFEKAVAEREKSKWTDICVRCHFLPARDYPTLLGCADLGVSLHTSSSGRDLPMKVVDMFGCGVPVLAKGFGCIDELVKHGENGLVFNTGEELGQQMIVCPSPLIMSQLMSRTHWLDSQIHQNSINYNHTSLNKPKGQTQKDPNIDGQRN
jgi:beta-1,4-mannosyltransferase